MDTPTNEFVAAFNQIEAWLNKQCHTTKYETYGTLLDKCKWHPMVQCHSYELRTFGELRNVATHGDKIEYPFVSVHPKTVAEIKALRDRMLSPPILRSVVKKQVFTCTIHDPIRTVLATMHDKDYSQMPVYSENGLYGLLNTETISRWLAAELEKGESVFGHEKVGDAMKYRSKAKTFHVLSETQTVFNALQLFDAGYEKGCSVEAIVVTNNGKRSEAATGIITESNLMELRDYMDLK